MPSAMPLREISRESGKITLFILKNHVWNKRKTHEERNFYRITCCSWARSAHGETKYMYFCILHIYICLIISIQWSLFTSYHESAASNYMKTQKISTYIDIFTRTRFSCRYLMNFNLSMIELVWEGINNSSQKSHNLCLMTIHLLQFNK